MSQIVSSNVQKPTEEDFLAVLHNSCNGRDQARDGGHEDESENHAMYKIPHSNTYHRRQPYSDQCVSWCDLPPSASLAFRAQMSAMVKTIRFWQKLTT